MGLQNAVFLENAEVKPDIIYFQQPTTKHPKIIKPVYTAENTFLVSIKVQIRVLMNVANSFVFLVCKVSLDG